MNMTEKRSATRKLASIPAMLASATADIPCTIVDLTDDGAKLRLRPGYLLSTTCFLRTVDLGGAIPGRVAWRRKNDVGVFFT